VAADVLGLPSFRPLSFLSNLAERVMQTEAEPTVPTNGNGSGPASTPSLSGAAITSSPADDGPGIGSAAAKPSRALRSSRATEPPQPTEAETTAADARADPSGATELEAIESNVTDSGSTEATETTEGTEPPEAPEPTEPPTAEEAPRG
jgi:hypothetical protein